MFVWSDIYFKFIEVTEGYYLKEKPETDFTGTVISITDERNCVEFLNGKILHYSTMMKKMLPEIVIGLSRNESYGPGWKIKGRIFDDSIELRATNSTITIG